MRRPDHVARLTSPSDEEAGALRQTLDSVGALASQGKPMRLTLRAVRALVGDGKDLVPVTEVRLAMLAQDWIRVSQPHTRALPLRVSEHTPKSGGWQNGGN